HTRLVSDWSSDVCSSDLAPQRLHEEVSVDYNDMIYATSAAEIEVRRRAFIRKWRLKCKAVADSLEEAGDRLFTFTRLPVSQWKEIGRASCRGRGESGEGA